MEFFEVEPRKMTQEVGLFLVGKKKIGVELSYLIQQPGDSAAVIELDSQALGLVTKKQPLSSGHVFHSPSQGQKLPESPSICWFSCEILQVSS